MIIESIKKLFIVRSDCYPQQIERKNEYTVARNTLTDNVIRRHLDGFITVGCWQTEPITRTVKWVCFDFDGIIEEEYEKAKRLFFKLKKKGFNPIMEFSGRKGYHIWLFLEPVDMGIARQFMIENSNKDVSDVYPKSNKIEKNGYGFQVKLPLGLHRVSMQRCFLFDDDLKTLSQKRGEEFLIDFNNRKRDRITLKNIKYFIGGD